jgi:hypothetical protein
MNTTVMYIAGLIVLPAIGLAIWAQLAMARVNEALRALSGFEGIHFEV